MKPDAETTRTTWTPAEDLEWTAFQYIANELPEADAAAFEQRLADDQAAREAVARCVELTHSVVALEEARSPEVASVLAASRCSDRRRRRWSVAAVLAAAVAVCLAFWIGTEFAGRHADEPQERVAQDHPQRPAAPANEKSGVKSTVPVKEASAIIATWLNFDAAKAIDSDQSVMWDEPAKPTSTPPTEGSFNWVIAAVDDAPLAVPVPEKSTKEPN